MKIRMGNKWLFKAKASHINLISTKGLFVILVITVFGFYQFSLFIPKIYAANPTQISATTPAQSPTTTSNPASNTTTTPAANTCNQTNGTDSFGLTCLHDQAVNQAKNDGQDPVFSRLATITNLLFALASAAMVFAAVWTGLLYIFSMGNEEQTKKAKKNFTYIVIGLILLLGSFTIIKVVINVITASKIAG